ncbi:MAG: aminoacetone oxidase family FAD-binding enzyme [Ruminococcaceae bacterium]|nr:aminoacetone oxidase family FAD-binding enzyme [Oscillospiraceae bacterium]
MKEILIIGGGASGMAAALRAAADKSNRVTLLERQARVGKKLLATGNGRCNLTNTQATPKHYHGMQPEFAEAALKLYPPEKVLRFFSGLGLRTVEEYGGRVYPMSDHAGSVVDVLRLALEREGVDLRCGAPVERIRRKGEGFAVDCGGETLHADCVIVACGGCAGSKLGGVTDGYELLKSLGHSRTALHPALTQIRTVPDYPRALKGIRACARLALLRGERCLGETRGDVLFTETGISGTAVFELSRIAAVSGEGLSASLGFFDEDEDVLFAELLERKNRDGANPANQILIGTVQSRLGQMLCKAAGLSGGESAAEVDERRLRALARVMRDFRLPITGVSGFENAQVTAGGVKTAEFDAQTLRSRLVPGLYACGEVLDIDGDCGGFNLQWAWASGLLAGELR